MQTKDTAALFKDIRAVYSRFDAPESALGLWTRALADLPPADVFQALEAWISESAFPPTPAELRKLATAGNPPAIDRQNADAEAKSHVTVYRRIDPATGDYLELEAPRIVPIEVFQKRYRELWSEYHRLNPQPAQELELAAAAAV